ncbi:MAG: MFS transporter [Planctomycetes bacterium]|nr:MFS transporter [Planctomycetota bacterium]
MDPDSLERRVVSKVSWRLLPYLFVLYIIAYVDRINVAVAQLQMSKDLVLDSERFGLAVGMFFIGYFVFEVPSNLVLSKVGARVWIARIMILWGIVTISMMFVKGFRSLCVLRVVLGSAEAGFFPGILFYMTKWFRGKDRARAISLFMTAGTLAGVVGNPISGALLKLDGLGGLKGWQWLFVIEGIPAVLLGISVLALLTESPESAKWLTDEERAWLRDELARERAGQGGPHAASLLQGLAHPAVWHLTGVYFLLATGAYGFEIWLPGIVKSLSGGSDFKSAMLSAIPYIVATVGMVIVGHHSDRTGERRWHVALSMFASTVGFILATRLQNPVLALSALSLAWVGLKAAQGPFWAIPPAFLTGTAAAGGIALINSIANLGGQIGPWLVGWLRKETGNFSAGLLMSAGLLFVSGALALTLRPPTKAREPSA